MDWFRTGCQSSVTEKGPFTDESGKIPVLVEEGWAAGLSPEDQEGIYHIHMDS